MQALSGLSARLESAPLSIQVRGQPFELDPKRVGYHVDAGQTAGRALKVGRNGGFVRQLSTWLGLFSRPVRLSARGTIDRSKLEPILAEWELRALNDRPYDGGLSVRGDRLVPVPPRGGFAATRRSRELIPHALGRERKEAVSLPRTGRGALHREASRMAVSQRRSSGQTRVMHRSRTLLWRFESGGA